MHSPLLLDTHAAYWVANDERISEEAAGALDDAASRDLPVLVSPISAWEIGMLVARNRLSLALSPESWFQRLLEVGGIELTLMPPAVLIASSFLPGDAPRDPADRIIAATARSGGYRLVTRDRVLLDYARAGHIRAIAC